MFLSASITPTYHLDVDFVKLLSSDPRRDWVVWFGFEKLKIKKFCNRGEFGAIVCRQFGGKSSTHGSQSDPCTTRACSHIWVSLPFLHQALPKGKKKFDFIHHYVRPFSTHYHRQQHHEVRIEMA